jgi:hypothetical protein
MRRPAPDEMSAAIDGGGIGAILLDPATGHVVEADPDFAVAPEVLARRAVG